jgi:hypothetical protein
MLSLNLKLLVYFFVLFASCPTVDIVIIISTSQDL